MMQGWEEEEEEKHALAHAQMQATQVWVCRVELPAVCWPRFLPHAGPDNCNLYGLLPTRAGHPCDWGFLIFERLAGSGTMGCCLPGLRQSLHRLVLRSVDRLLYVLCTSRPVHSHA